MPRHAAALGPARLAPQCPDGRCLARDPSQVQDRGAADRSAAEPWIPAMFTGRCCPRSVDPTRGAGTPSACPRRPREDRRLLIPHSRP